MDKKEDLQVYQSNPLLRARKHYGILEHRLLRLALADLKPHLKNSAYYDKEIRPFHMETSEVVEVFGGSTNKRIYEQLREACKQMFDSRIELGDDKNFKLVHLFSEISFDSKKGLDIYFSQRVKNLLLEMERGNYTRTLLSLSFSLSSKYSLILLELMLQYQGKQKNGIIERDLSIDELRFSLDVPENAYTGRMNNFRRFVIDSAIAEINEKTDYRMEPEYGLARGRFNKVTGFHFILHLPTAKAKNAIPIPAMEDTPDRKIELETGQTQLFEDPKILEPQNEEELEHLGRLGKYEIAPQTGRRLIKKYGWERIDANLKYAYEHSQRKENMSGWVIDCIKNDRAAEAAEAKRLAKMAAEKKQKEILARLEPLPFEKEPPRELPEDSPFKKFERRHKARKANSEK